MRVTRTLLSLCTAGWLLSVSLVTTTAAPQLGQPAASPSARRATLFEPSSSCLACHNQLTTSSGEDISIGSNWRASMMANSSRDPYWQAGVRREIMDHPTAQAAIEDECSICHMPMARTQAKTSGGEGAIFAHLPVVDRTSPLDALAHDGVSCTLCHQITTQKLGTPDSFTGGFVIDTAQMNGPRPIFGPFVTDKGRTTIMRSSATFQPTQGMHVRQSELCATCHTLITQALGPGGAPIGRLPEQMPYVEWQHSAFREEKSCQACHMPVVEEDTPAASVLGPPRAGVSRHTFIGGNFFMLRMLNRYRAELGVTALPQELDAAARRTIENLQSQTVSVAIERAEMSGAQLAIDLSVPNLTGHKLPTGYPSRRVWLHLTVRDRAGTVVFESGGLAVSGLIQANDNDADPGRIEPHYTEISRADQVQIYESVMGDMSGAPTTGLLSAVRFLKDNRLLPRGFDKATAVPDIAVIGGAAQDADFTGDGDRIRYLVDAAAAVGPFQIDVELRFQPIAFRWAENLKSYNAPEPQRFVGYYDSMSASSAATLARATALARIP
ncbi:MAG: hypothetical protein A3H95_02385 [Acidobacteria bacterium RIFCSPLOWO2_02_FULL_64_15]|nr:MAG: hypothetical protein A3H95_02385 [Acidobacteria bacterium RIFCSPLOWO2_02_FULL_64_15]